jgi:polyisoprenyl-phosphate glycosyltransferase
MKKISILIPCYNEQENVVQMSKAVTGQMTENLSQYDYELVFIDNNSSDSTRPLLREVCRRNKKIKAIFNAKNFGQFNSPFYGICQTSGDCTICLCCDFQDPVELIPVFVHEWEKGAKIVSGIKTTSKENKLIRFFRTCYYRIIKKMSQVEQIEHFTGFGLYDRSFVDVLRNLHDPTPFLRGIVAELGFKRVDISYTQAKRRAGKTHNNWYTLYDAAMLSFTSYTKIGLRVCTITGFIVAFFSVIVALIYLILKLCNWNSFSAGTAPMVIGVFFMGALQLFFIGFIGEYVMAINTRVMDRPLVIEEERINF